jgi:hypothetical protein
VAESSAPAQVQAPEHTETTTTAPEIKTQDAPVKPEKLFTQDQFNVASNDVKKRTEQKVEARLRAEFAEKLASLQQQSNSSAAMSQPVEASKQVYTEDQVWDVIQRRQQEAEQTAKVQYVASEFVNKVQSANAMDKLEKLGISKVSIDSPIVSFLNSVDNIGDVLSDFNENPIKLANLDAIYRINPELATQELQKLSQSIKRNKEALEKEKAPVPSDKLRPSSLGLGSGTTSISSIRKSDKSLKW